MTQVSEITEHEYTSQELQKQSRLKALVSIAKMLIKNPAALRKYWVMGPDEERYVRSPREYELPEYRQGMKYCTSNEKYLRPTRWCNPREPEVIALANKLGAYELSDYEFAEAAFLWVKTNLQIELRPFDSVSATLERGTGTCYHLISVWIALCRAAGIRARYKTFNLTFSEDSPVADMPGLEMFNTGSTPEAEGEVYVDGKWVVGHAASIFALSAIRGKPIVRLGTDLADVGPWMVPGSIKRFESLSLGMGILIKTGMPFVKASMERTNVYLSTACSNGKKIIEEAGGIEAYDQRAREELKLSSPVIELSGDEALVFEE
jgi:hypothetical protein